MKLIASVSLLALSLCLNAQTISNETLYPSKDALIRSLGGIGTNQNFPNYQWLNMHAWTNGGSLVLHRSLIDFDLSHIPVNSTINSAYLHLSVPPNGSMYAAGHHLANENSCEVSRITGSWNENQVTWQNQPTRSGNNQVIIPAASSNYQGYMVDVTAMVQDMVNNPNNSHGFYLKLVNENYYRRMVFASSDSPHDSLSPELILNYTTPTPIASSVEVEILQDAMIRQFGGVGDNQNYGSYKWINMHSWTNGGNPVNHRSLIEFDLSQIPDTAVLHSAVLSLKMDRDPNTPLYFGGHQFGNGIGNTCYIKRITTPWDEYQVTWQNQPSVSNQSVDSLRTSSAAFQDYNIDVTTLVSDMLNDTANSHGFYLQQMFETPFRRMVFASRNNLDSTAHPKLLLNFSNNINIDLKETRPSRKISVYPNPAQDLLFIDLPEAGPGIIDLEIYSLTGQLVLKKELSQVENKIDLSDLGNGIYIYHLNRLKDQDVLQSGKILVK